ncbi:Invasion protein IalB, involved in pathogenesis [Palleronia salina]|uniref:Invasion protein IalB, involved in pathogenesis n=1 Tax=Palleronia salina TaxID=313368 RepID=A0A1M6AYV7_9RHOB|nr:invasion associated locus B family protein [Palleronia salina]SHI41617.1 Invasion protein IalB, involved in pathogenesis [Palleronia salina]
MPKLMYSLSLAALLALPFGAHAQDDAAATDGAETESAPQVVEPSGTDGLSMGAPVEDENAPGRSYTAGEFGDWQQRCIRTEDGSDPCQLYQLLRDSDGNAVAEMSVFPLPPGREAQAGATIITPLETLLTRALTLQIDSGQAKRYPFEFCAAAGCFSRIGLTGAEVESFKRGAQGTLTIAPAAAPDQTIELTVSLSGFTAGYEAVAEANTN